MKKQQHFVYRKSNIVLNSAITLEEIINKKKKLFCS